MSSIPTITATPVRDREDFWEQAELAWNQLPPAIDGINANLATVEGAAAAVAALAGAVPWVALDAYDVPDIVVGPDGFVYRVTGAVTSATPPAEDPAHWTLRTVMGLPLVYVSGTTHTAQVNTFCVLINPAATELTAPVMTVGDEFGIRVANGRWDNVLKGNGQRIEGQDDDVALDWWGVNGLWRYLQAGSGGIGIGRV